VQIYLSYLRPAPEKTNGTSAVKKNDAAQATAAVPLPMLSCLY
jgi:hypothetical protein